jgi:trigger factor
VQITEQRLDAQNLLLNVHVSPEDYSEPVRKTLNDYAKKANIPGFRKGKVPMSIVKKMVGKGVVYDELNRSLSQTLRDYIKEKELSILGEPLPVKKEELDLDPDSTLSYDFQYEIGLAPDFTLNLNLSSSISRYKVEVDEETLQKEIDYQRSRFGNMSNPEVSGEGDILFGKISECDAEGNVIEDGLNRIGTLNPQRVPDAKIIAEMVGRKAGDTIRFTMPQVFDSREAVRNFWERNAQNEQVREIDDRDLDIIFTKQFVFEVRKVNHVDLAEVNQDLFDKVFPGTGITTEAEFRDKLREDVQGFFERESLNEFRARLMRTVVDAIQIPLPDAFLKKYLLETREKLSPDVLENVYPSYASDLRWNLIINRIMNENPEYKVTQEDVNAAAEVKLRTQFAAMLGNTGDDLIKSLIPTYLEKQERVEEIVNEVVTVRVQDHLVKFVNAVEQPITAKAFMELR